MEEEQEDKVTKSEMIDAINKRINNVSKSLAFSGLKGSLFALRAKVENAQGEFVSDELVEEYNNL